MHLPRSRSRFFPLARPRVWLYGFFFSLFFFFLHFAAQVFFRVVFKGASSCFLSGYLPGPDKEVRLPAVSALNPRAAFSMARLTYTVKRLSQHWRSRLCVKRQTARGGDWKKKWIYVLLLFIILSGQCAAPFFFIRILMRHAYMFYSG